MANQKLVVIGQGYVGLPLAMRGCIVQLDHQTDPAHTGRWAVDLRGLAVRVLGQHSLEVMCQLGGHCWQGVLLVVNGASVMAEFLQLVASSITANSCSARLSLSGDEGGTTRPTLAFLITADPSPARLPMIGFPQAR